MVQASGSRSIPIGVGKYIGTTVMRNTHENISVHTRTDPNKVAVSVDIRGYYTPAQVDQLIELLQSAKDTAIQEHSRLQHEPLFGDIANDSL